MKNLLCKGSLAPKCCKCPVLVVRHPYTAESGVVGGTVLVGTTSLCLHELPWNTNININDYYKYKYSFTMLIWPLWWTYDQKILPDWFLVFRESFQSVILIFFFFLFKVPNFTDSREHPGYTTKAVLIQEHFTQDKVLKILHYR